jgi:tRNA(fMet)-specific endonuclease VapC
VSAIAVAELEFGAAKSKWPGQARQALAQFLLPLVILDFDRAAAEAYGGLQAALEAQGKLIGANDMLIAAQAISAGLTLVSNNAREFGRVPGLRFENWGA